MRDRPESERNLIAVSVRDFGDELEISPTYWRKSGWEDAENRLRVTRLLRRALKAIEGIPDEKVRLPGTPVGMTGNNKWRYHDRTEDEK